LGKFDSIRGNRGDLTPNAIENGINDFFYGNIEKCISEFCII